MRRGIGGNARFWGHGAHFHGQPSEYCETYLATKNGFGIQQLQEKAFDTSGSAASFKEREDHQARTMSVKRLPLLLKACWYM